MDGLSPLTVWPAGMARILSGGNYSGTPMREPPPMFSTVGGGVAFKAKGFLAYGS